MEMYYIEYYNKSKNFAKDKKTFKGNESQKVLNNAIKWGLKNLDNFNFDMIKHK